MKAQYISHYLSDRDVANFARQSFATLADNFTEAQNSKLIQFLARGMTSGDWDTLCSGMQHTITEKEAKELATYLRKIPEHWVPFGHPHISLRMQAPIPIRVQCFKHKVGFVESEESRRYISTKPEFYMPDAFRSAAASVKQGSAGVHLTSDWWLKKYATLCNEAIDNYQFMLQDGICPEQARFILPQGCEVNWVWTGSLYAFANFYNLRSDSHAQKEIQLLSEQVSAIIKPLYPVSWCALTEGAY
jgi:thymidylate synthase (FAD)